MSREVFFLLLVLISIKKQAARWTQPPVRTNTNARPLTSKMYQPKREVRLKTRLNVSGKPGSGGVSSPRHGVMSCPGVDSGSTGTASYCFLLSLMNNCGQAPGYHKAGQRQLSPDARAFAGAICLQWHGRHVCRL